MPAKNEGGIRVKDLRRTLSGTCLGKAVHVMKTLVWVIAVAAVVLMVIGLTVRTLGFLIGAAPVLLIIAVVLLLLNRSRGRRIPR